MPPHSRQTLRPLAAQPAGTKIIGAKEDKPALTFQLGPAVTRTVDFTCATCDRVVIENAHPNSGYMFSGMVVKCFCGQLSAMPAELQRQWTK